MDLSRERKRASVPHGTLFLTMPASVRKECGRLWHIWTAADATGSATTTVVLRF